MRVFECKRMGYKALSLVIPVVLVFSQVTTAQDKPDWQKHIDWASSDTGAPDCPWLYVTSDLQGCLALGLATGNHSGNRSCVIQLAGIAARTGDQRLQGVAFSYVLLTQCHNGGAQQAIINAGPGAVINYLKQF
jgi:hypothetical protein